jgi:hypothetical protein
VVPERLTTPFEELKCIRMKVLLRFVVFGHSEHMRLSTRKQYVELCNVAFLRFLIQFWTEILAALGFKSEFPDQSGGQKSIISDSYLELAHTKFAAASTLPEPLYVAT